MNDKQDAFEESLDICSELKQSKISSAGRDVRSVTLWNEANKNDCQTPKDSLKDRCGTSPKQEKDFTTTGPTDMNHVDETAATKGHRDVLVRNVVQENGYGSSPDKMRRAAINALRHCHYEQNIHPERPRTFDAPLAVDSLPKGNRTIAESDKRHRETRKTKDPGPRDQQDFNKTGISESEVTKIVPLKPQRSKKSSNKDNKDSNPQTQSQSDRGIAGVTADEHMTKSRDRSCVAGGRGGVSAIDQSATDFVEENIAKSDAAVSNQQQTQQGTNELFGQPEIRNFRGTAGRSASQCTRGGGPHEDHYQSNSEFKETLFSSSKVPTAPPRSLPLKKQWSRDRRSNADSSHIHYRLPGQDTSKRKQAVNHLPALFVKTRKAKHSETLHELRRCDANTVLTISKKKNHECSVLQKSCGCV